MNQRRPTMVIGRVLESPEGTFLEPLDRGSKEYLAAWVVEAARIYRDYPSLDNLDQLIEATRAMRDHQD